MNHVGITAENASLDFQLKKPGALDRLTHKPDGKLKSIHRAVDHVSFELRQGDRVGLIGRNGAGKSSLLKMMSGILTPTSGSMALHGKAFPLLNLSADILAQATCLQNIKLRGLLLGFTGDVLDEYICAVRANSDLESFLYSPVSTLSTGMKTRFLLSLLGNVKPELLIMDEWIGTTDKSFIEEKESRLNQLINASGIFVLATHNQSLVERFCNKLMLIDKGKLLFLGGVEAGFEKFQEITRR